MKSTLFCLLCLISFQCISQTMAYKMTELFSLRESTSLTIAFLAGKGFKKTGEKNGMIILTNSNESISLVKREGMITAIDYETTDTSQFRIWTRDMTETFSGKNPIYGSMSDECYYLAMMYNSKACFSIVDKNYYNNRGNKQ